MGTRSEKKPVVVTAITSPVSATLIRGQLRFMKENGFTPILVSSPGEDVRKLAETEGVQLCEIAMEREPSLFKDVISLVRLIVLFMMIRPDIVNAGTPKAGFLCMTASYICGIRGRIYTIRGFRHESLSGFLRILMKNIERLSCFFSNQVVCISSSVADFGIEEGILKPGGFKIAGKGSSNGIDLSRFSLHRQDLLPPATLRARLGLSGECFVIGFVGRIIDRKGVDELVKAFAGIKVLHPHARLLLIGPVESSQSVAKETLDCIQNDERIICLGLVDDVESYYRVMDLFVLPAYWEGFGNVLLEAAAMGVPTITCDATGTKDAVSDGFNGTLVPVKDVEALFKAINSYITDEASRSGHGHNGPLWAAQFSNVAIWSGLLQLYQSVLARK